MPLTIRLGEDLEYNLILKISTGTRSWSPIPGISFEIQIGKFLAVIEEGHREVYFRHLKGVGRQVRTITVLGWH